MRYSHVFPNLKTSFTIFLSFIWMFFTLLTWLFLTLYYELLKAVRI